ncbi:hypothetical protein BDR22DRAFT_960487 [Usnea florida]
MSIPIDELREMYKEDRETSKVLSGLIDRQVKRIDRLVNENDRLVNENKRLDDELRSARNDNELTRSVGEGRQSSSDEETKRELQSKLDAANASIEEIQHSRKELDQELRTERRRNADLQASLEQAQDAKAELEQSLQRMQYAWDEGDRFRASDYAERSHELEERLAEREQSLQMWEKRLQEKEKYLQPNQRSSSGAVVPIKQEPLAQPNLRLNPRAVAFRPTDSKSTAQVAVGPPPPVVSLPKERDVTADFIASFLAKVEAEEDAKADALAKSKTPDNKKVNDAAAGKKVEPGRPKSSDTPPHVAITGKRKFEGDGMSSAQQSGPSSSEAGEKKKKFLR